LLLLSRYSYLWKGKKGNQPPELPLVENDELLPEFSEEELNLLTQQSTDDIDEVLDTLEDYLLELEGKGT
jgi:hypothetical protein